MDLASGRASTAIAIVRNPESGSALDRDALTQALDGQGVAADILDIPDGGNFEAWIDGVAGKYDVIVATGGDGTVSSVAAAARAGKTFGVIPSGTLNHFARDAGIPLELDQAVAVLGGGAPRPVDYGMVNDQFFLNNVSIGNYPRMVRKREAIEERGRSKRIAGLVAVAQTWWDLRNVTASITTDDRNLVRRSPFILIGNGSYVLSGFALGKRETISDHQLSLYVAPSTGRLGVLSLPLRALVSGLDQYEQFESFSAKKISITLRHPRVLAGIDGEVRELASPLRFELRSAALQVLLP